MLNLTNNEFQVKIDWYVQEVLINLYLSKIPFIIEDDKGKNFKILSFDVQPKKNGLIFKMKIYYQPIFKNGVQQMQPLLFCLNDDIRGDIDNHISKTGNICYFYPGDLSHKSAISCLYCMQCAIKWCDCYSFWLDNQEGGWPCKEMPHGSYHPNLFNISRPFI
jgi:hypothetical protein